MKEVIPSYQSSIDFVILKLKDYSSIPAPTYKETPFLEYLVKDFINGNEGNCIVIKKALAASKEQLQYVYLSPITSNYEYFFTVHVDRVKGYKGPYTNTIDGTKELGMLYGQLDNIISLGILRYLWELGYRFGLLLTTEEEINGSWGQVLDIKLKSQLTPISIDIDAYPRGLIDKMKETGEFTLRERDGYGEMDKFHVWKFRKLAVKSKMAFIQDDNHLCLVETGLMSSRTDGKHKGVHIGLPIANYHTDKEVWYPY